MRIRLFVNLEGKGILCAGVEGFSLAAECCPYDPLAAEFIRNFQDFFLFDKPYSNRLDRLMCGVSIHIDKCIPKKRSHGGRERKR